jgi:hypothetical protein
VLLRGKTFEEVERIISASTGEIEVIIRSAPTGSGRTPPRSHRQHCNGPNGCDEPSPDDWDPEGWRNRKTEKIYDSVARQPPPVPAHGSARSEQNGLGLSGYERTMRRDQQGYGGDEDSAHQQRENYKRRGEKNRRQLLFDYNPGRRRLANPTFILRF